MSSNNNKEEQERILLEEIENKREHQHVRRYENEDENDAISSSQQQQGGENNNNNNDDALMRSFISTATIPTNDDIVCIKRDCQDEKFAWLKPYIGLVTKIRQPGEVDAPSAPAGSPEEFDPSFKYEEQSETFCIVEFNLFHANLSPATFNNNNTDDTDDATAAASTSSSPQHQQHQYYPYSKVSLPSGVLHAALPSSVLQILDRGISALDTVVHIKSRKIGSVGGYRLTANAMPIQFPENLEKNFFNALKQHEVFERAGLLEEKENENDEENNNNKNYKYIEHLPILEDDSNNKTTTKTANSFKLHCTDFMPSNPYRRTVAVAHKKTLQVGFVDDAVMSAIILLDNGSIALVDDVDSLHKELTRPPKKHHRHHNKKRKFMEDGGDEDDESDDDEYDADSRLVAQLKQLGVKIPKHLKDKIKKNKNKKKKKNSGKNKNNEDDEDEEENDEDFQEEYVLDEQLEYDPEVLGGKNSNTQQQTDGLTMDDVIRLDELQRKQQQQEQETENNNKKKVSADKFVNDDDEKENEKSKITYEDNQEGFAPYDEESEEDDDDENDENEEGYYRGELETKWEDIDNQLLDDAVWPPPPSSPKIAEAKLKKNRVLLKRVGSTASNLSQHNNNNNNEEEQETNDDNDDEKNNNNSFDENLHNNNNFSTDMDRFDHEVGKIHGLPLWAKTKPTLGWFRRVIIPHKLVQDGESIIMAVGQPDYEKNKERGYDVGTIICLSCTQVYVKWVTPHYDPHSEAPPAVIEECSPKDLFIVQNFYHELLGVDFLHDIAFLRAPVDVTVDENDDENNNNNVDPEENIFALQNHGTVQDREADRIRARQSYQKIVDDYMMKDLKFAENNDENEKQKQQHHHHLLPFYNFEEVESSTSALDSIELNKFYERFLFPESIERATKKLRGRKALPNLLYDEEWRKYFSRLSAILKNAVRIVNIESTCCVTWSNREREAEVKARDLVRPETHPGSLFEHLTCVPRDTVCRPDELIEFQNNTGFQQENTSTNQEREKHDQQQHICHVHKNEPIKIETCALFDIGRCTYPDTDCVVSDVVTLRTRDQEAQVAALSGPPPRNIGQVLSIDPKEMTAEVAWMKFCEWEKLIQQQQNNNNNPNSSSSSSSRFSVNLDRYPTI